MKKEMATQSTDPFKKIKPVTEKFQPLPFGSIKPTGWLQQQVQQNLDGFTGHLDSLVPDLILKDDIYGKNRLTRHVKSKDVGALGEAGDWQVQFLWWNSETQGNWLDGYIRSAILNNDAYHLQRVKKIIDYLLSTQGDDGYIGIYDHDLRYKFDNENGELWAKTTLLRGLLAWFEYSNDKTVFNAIEKAVKNVMDNYPINASHPFNTVKPDVGGLSHGLMFTDILEAMYRITTKRIYSDYIIFCYKDFSQQVMNEDGQYKKLLNAKLSLEGHGVHTYEQLRTVAAAYYASGNPQLLLALKNYLQKIVWTTTASGGPIGDEWIRGHKADATSRGYEYCSLQELMHSYEELLIKTGDAGYADKVERIFFNAAQGARHPEQSCIAYLKSDNSYYMFGGLNGDTTVKHQTRYTYSPVHQDAAVCCVPNAGRITPYFVQYAWMKEKNNVVASLLAPCNMETVVNGNKVYIKEETDYPYKYTVRFIIATDNTDFGLKIRIPAWANKFSVNEKYEQEDGFIVIRKKWNGKQIIEMKFFPEIKTEQDINKEYFFSYGPLVLAHSIKGVPASTKAYPLPGFSDLAYKPEKLVLYQYNQSKVQKENDSLEFTTTLFNPARGEEQVILQPMSKTILRQVTFKPKIAQ